MTPPTRTPTHAHTYTYTHTHIHTYTHTHRHTDTDTETETETETETASQPGRQTDTHTQMAGLCQVKCVLVFLVDDSNVSSSKHRKGLIHETPCSNPYRDPLIHS